AAGLVPLVANADVGAIIGVVDPLPPARGERGAVDGVTVVLAGHPAPVRAHLDARLILRAVPEFQLVGVGPGGQREDLAAQADAEGRDALFQRAPDVLHRFADHLGIAGSVR